MFLQTAPYLVTQFPRVGEEYVFSEISAIKLMATLTFRGVNPTTATHHFWTLEIGVGRAHGRGALRRFGLNTWVTLAGSI